MSLLVSTFPRFSLAPSNKQRDMVESVADRAYFWCLFFFISLSPYIREYGGALLFAFLAVEIAYVIWTRSFVIYPPLIAFTALGFLYVILSYAESLPNAWARFSLVETIPQQASFLAILYPTILAARRQWNFLLQTPSASWRVITLALAGGVVSQMVAPDMITSDYKRFFLSPGNGGFFMFFAVSYFLLFRPSLKASGFSLCVVITGAILAPQLQTQLLYLLIFILMYSPSPRFILAGWCLFLVAIYFIAYMFPAWIWDIDPNSGIRAFFARDAIQALWETNGIGVGFGKEAIKHYYPSIGHLHGNPQNDFNRFIMISIHNSFVAMFYRLGILGGFLWLWTAIIAVFPSAHSDLAKRKFYSAIFAAMFIAMFTNVGLESPTFSPAVAFALGILMSQKERSAALVYRTK